MTYKYKHLFKKLLVGFSRYYKKVLKCNKVFISYAVYDNKVAFLDRFNFEQKVRRDNIKNIKEVGFK